jgi:hypothetical protein
VAEGNESGVFVANIVAPQVVAQVQQRFELSNVSFPLADLVFEFRREIFETSLQKVFDFWFLEHT